MKLVVFLALFAAGCLDAPPEAVNDPEEAPLVLGSVADDDNLTLDGQHELVIAGIHRSGGAEQPVALVLFASESGIEAAVAGGAAVELDFEPIDIAFTRREDVTGLAVLLGPGGELVSIDQDLVSEEIRPTTGGDAIDLAFDHIAALQTLPGSRLVLSQAGEVWITDQLLTDTTFSDLPAWKVKVGDAIEWLAGVDVAGTNTVAAVTVAGDIDSSVVTPGDPPMLDPDQVADVVPAPLDPVVWRGSSHGFAYLVGVNRSVPDIFWHQTAVPDTGTTSGSVLEGRFDLIHDLLITTVSTTVPDLVVLGERGGALFVELYDNPLFNDAFDIGTPATFEIPADLVPPVWMRAMDAVGGDSGANEIIVYDQVGRVVCVDRIAGSGLTSCGSADLAALVAP